MRRQLLRWATDVLARISDSDLQPPTCGNDRARNNWAPLYRIASALGGAWPKRIGAAYALKEQAGMEAEESAGVMLLRDTMEVFAERRADRMQSSELGVVTEADLAELRQHKVEVLALLREDERDRFEERAAILEFDAGLSRHEAERRARKEADGEPSPLPASPGALEVGGVYRHPETGDLIRWDGQRFVVVN